MSDLTLNLAVIALYLVLVVAVGLWAGRRMRQSTEGYFLGGRSFGWCTVGLSIFATNISAMHFLGTNGLTHRIGIAAINPELIGGLMLGVSAIFFVPLYLRSRITTLPEFMEQRYSRAAKLVFGGMYLFQAVTFAPISFYIGGLAVLGVMGLDPAHLGLVCLIIGVTAGSYAVFGGLNSLVRTDTIQTALLVTAGLIVAFAGLREVGGWTALREQLGPEPFQLLQPRGGAMPWTAIPGIIIASGIYFIASVAILQRALGARSVYDARNGMIFAGFLKLLAIPLFAIPGLVAAQMYPGAASDATYAMLLADVIPAGLAGLVLAGLLAALMSTGEAGVNAISSVVALDFHPAVTGRRDPAAALRVGKWTGALVMVFGIVGAPYVKHLGPIYPFLLGMGGYGMVPIGVCFIGGRFWRRANSHGALATMMVGFGVGMSYIFLANVGDGRLLPAWLRELHFYEVIPFFAAFCGVILYSVSRLTPLPSARCLAVLESKGEATNAVMDGGGWTKDYRVWWGLFLVVFVATYAVLF
jgi:SSS family solute:Na+ symporter